MRIQIRHILSVVLIASAIGCGKTGMIMPLPNDPPPPAFLPNPEIVQSLAPAAQPTPLVVTVGVGPGAGTN